ncbi:YcaC related amidohydrolase [Metarhizium album ARSEF 1941]|uniref:YcaC related amidohydrolase n=1 Tax=Metarhizium album (strain ARSEF 1941) TaxID=1081103 RepID=A0A0B2WTY8_METAS|nr:YcaC related amidohydrolase [Metarhizium album ARSEF 1941]KHN97523.1 YcaC related amidohydrolase [Metarhizium album ARSEF 1941]
MKLLPLTLTALATVAAAADGYPGEKFTYERLDKNNSLLLIVDHQVGLFHTARDLDPNLFRDQVTAHAALGKIFGLPVIMTTSTQAGPNGPLPREIVQMHPDAPLILREGEVNAWDNQEFRSAVVKTGKKQIILAGVTTDANAEASGTTSALVRDISNDAMSRAGIHVVSLFSIACDLMRDWRGTPGAKEMIPFFDEYFPVWGHIARAHQAAVRKGTVLAGEEKLNG